MNNFNVIDSTGNSKIPYGCMAFGVDVTSSAVDHWINTWKSLIDEMNVLLVLAGTKTAEVKGISAAGATAEARKYTAIADAELLIKGPSSPKRWPLPPLPAGVSPALISHVCSKLLGLNPVVCAIGLSQFPTCPCLKVEDPSLGPADCLSKGKAMDIKRVEMLWEKGFAMGLKLKKPLMLAECVPGGTSTALAVLTGLGIAAAELVSGSVKNTPISLKKSLVEQGLKRGGIGPHSSPKSVLAAVGDPFQAFAVVLLLGARES